MHVEKPGRTLGNIGNWVLIANLNSEQGGFYARSQSLAWQTCYQKTLT